MADKLKKRANFLHELKRRNVFRVIAMYAGAAFVIIELINNVVDPLRLPQWLPTIVILLLIVGFPVTAILSWIFDLTPEGVRKTQSLEESEKNLEPVNTGRRRLRPSDVIITVLIIAVGILVYPKIFGNDQFEDSRDPDGKLAIAVMPFENLSGDTIFNIWQGGFQNLLITTLSNSAELSVRKYHAVNDVLNNKKDISLSSLSPSFVRVLGQKLDTKTLILGNILKAGNKIRITAQLVDAETEEIYKTYQIDGDSENDMFNLADNLSGMIKNYVEIKKLSEQYNSRELRGHAITNSSEAFKNYIRGWDAFKYRELESAIEWFTKAIEEDSTFISAYVFISYANLMYGLVSPAKYWVNKAYEYRSVLSLEEKLALDQLYAYFYETPYEEIKYLKQLIEIDKLNPLFWHQLGLAYFKLFEYEDAIRSWEQIFTIHEKWGTYYKNPYVYFMMGIAYHKLNEHDKEEKIAELGLEVYPEAVLIIQNQAICAFSHGETEKAEKILAEYQTMRLEVLHCTEAMISSGVGTIYSSSGLFERAEDYYREATQLEPLNLDWKNEFAWFLIDNDIDVEEGLKLADEALEMDPGYWPAIDSKGWALYKLGKYEEALKLLKDSWDLKFAYSHYGYLHIQEVQQAVNKQNESSP
jgi:TolB-like protein/Tfp pilus assembly protein PilF